MKVNICCGELGNIQFCLFVRDGSKWLFLKSDSLNSWHKLKKKTKQTKTKNCLYPEKVEMHLYSDGLTLTFPCNVSLTIGKNPQQNK